MKQISIALLLCLCTLAGFAQSGKALDLKEIVSGKFTPKNISGVIPIPGDGEHYSQMNADRTQNHQVLLQKRENPWKCCLMPLPHANARSRHSTATALLRTAVSCSLPPKQLPSTVIPIRLCITSTA